MNNKLGIHLANGPNPLSRIKQLGARSYLALHHQLGDLKQLANSDPSLYCVVRYYSSSLFTDEGLERTIVDLGWIRDLVPGNELNLPWETGGIPYSALAVADRLGTCLSRIREQFPHVRVHLPAFSPSGSYLDYYKACQSFISPALFDVVDVHTYGNIDELVKPYEAVHSLFPSKPLLISEFNFGAGRRVDLPTWTQRHMLPFLLGLPSYVEAAIWFVWRWDRPDPHVGNSLDLEGSWLESWLKNNEETSMNLYQLWLKEGGSGQRDAFVSHLRAIGKADADRAGFYGFPEQTGIDLDKIKRLARELNAELGNG